MAPSKDDKDLADAFLAHVLKEQTEAYLERGRRFERITDDKLKEMWIQAVRRFASGNREVFEYNDLCAEFSLRGLRLPEEAVKSEVEAMAAEVRRLGVGPMTDRANEQIADFIKGRDNNK